MYFATSFSQIGAKVLNYCFVAYCHLRYLSFIICRIEISAFVCFIAYFSRNHGYLNSSVLLIVSFSHRPLVELFENLPSIRGLSLLVVLPNIKSIIGSVK